jgi:hypothetical protein
MKPARPFLLLVVLAASACSGASKSPPPEDTVENVAGVDTDGYLVMVARDPDNTLIHLVDPTTGKAGKEQIPLLNTVHADDVVAISPDGQRVAWIGLMPGTTLRTVTVAEVAIQDGLPAFSVLRTFEGLVADRLRWSPDGDRLFTRHQWLDPETGTVADCLPGAAGTDEGTVHPIVPFPGGHVYACPGAGSLYDDGVRVADAVDVGDARSADGQWFGATLHVPSLTRRPIPGGFSLPALAQPVPAGEGRWAAVAAGVNGTFVSEESGGFSIIYHVNTSTEVPVDVPTVEVATLFAAGDTGPTTTWPLAGSLGAWMNDGEGRRWAPIGVADDGEHLTYAVASWKIANDAKKPNQQPVEAALIEVDAAGKARGFKTSEVSSPFLPLGDSVEVTDVERHFQADVLGRSGRLELPNGDWLVPAGAETEKGTSTHWVGYVGGKPLAVRNAGIVTRDGGTFVGVRAGDGVFRLCMRPFQGATLGGTKCFEEPLPGNPIGVMGQGTKASRAGDAPLILDVNRRAAWPGSPVTVHGAHFGASGTVKVGGVEVKASDIVAWSDHRITFTMSEALPASGAVEVSTTAGSGGAQRRFWLHRTKLADSPFAKIATAPSKLSQGLNALDLGDLGSIAAVKDSSVVLDPAARLADGRYVVWSAGATPPAPREIKLQSGPYERLLRFDLQSALADPARWQLVLPRSVDPVAQRPAFLTIAGDLVERSGAQHPVFAERFTFPEVDSTSGLPDFFREVAGGALTVNAYGGTYPRSLGLLSGWVGKDGLWGKAQYAASPNTNLPNYFEGAAAADGNLVLAVGGDPLGNPGAAFLFSNDGGKTLGPVQLAAPTIPGSAAFREPILVHAQGGDFFLVIDAGYNAPQILGLHAIAKDGTLTPNVAPVPPGAEINGGTVHDAPLTLASAGGRVAIHFGHGKTLAVVDFDQPAPHAWSVAPGAADQGKVMSIFEDPASHDLLAVRVDGSVARATAAGKWADWAPLDLGINLALPTKVTPVALGKLADGRWMALAQLFTADGAAPSPLAQGGFLVSPKP